MTPEQAAGLRAIFPPETVGKLPKIGCKNCSDSRTKNCDKHQKSKCRTCGNWITEAHVHLDYVGHAAITDRLLKIDNEWTWEPVAMNQEGLPAVDRDGNLWIRLTVAGVTRLGVGDGNSMKERIGDAIRNAAMRFGVAIDLWAKEDLSADRIEIPQPEDQPERHLVSVPDEARHPSNLQVAVDTYIAETEAESPHDTLGVDPVTGEIREVPWTTTTTSGPTTTAGASSSARAADGAAGPSTESAMPSTPGETTGQPSAQTDLGGVLPPASVPERIAEAREKITKPGVMYSSDRRSIHTAAKLLGYEGTAGHEYARAEGNRALGQPEDTSMETWTVQMGKTVLRHLNALVTEARRG